MSALASSKTADPYLNLLGGGEHLLQTEECPRHQIVRPLPHVLLGEVRDVCPGTGGRRRGGQWGPVYGETRRYIPQQGTPDGLDTARRV